MAVLVTGAAGFIGHQTCQKLLARGEDVVGIDNMSDYYDVRLKEARLATLADESKFQFRKLDISDPKTAEILLADYEIDRIVHLAAQAGVRYSLVNPYAYIASNVMGHTVMSELARALQERGRMKHFVYASSSSVYGGNEKLPFSVEDRADHPVSLYAATKRSDELIAHCYAHLYRIPSTGLRFFTVYGPWGRPDMALFTFTKAILEGRPIQVFNNGDMMRDFTYIDDIVDGVVRVLDAPPADEGTHAPASLYNIGNHRAERLLDMIATLEKALGRKAEKQLLPMQPGDVKATYADIDAIQRDLGFQPSTPMSVGIPKFVDWYRDFYQV